MGVPGVREKKFEKMYFFLKKSFFCFVGQRVFAEGKIVAHRFWRPPVFFADREKVAHIWEATGFCSQEKKLAQRFLLMGKSCTQVVETTGFC